MSTNRLLGMDAALLCYGEWTTDGEPPEPCIAIQVDSFGLLVISQEERSIQLRGAQADEVIAELRRIRKMQKDVEK